jgi:tetratricopeptide (TPR) repeat protein
VRASIAAPARCIAVAALVAGFVVTAYSSEALLDTAALDRWWDFDHPAASETRFRSELVALPTESTARFELMTQIARAEGLQRRFTAAHVTLDQVLPAIRGRPPRLSIRYLLERGRVFNSSRQPERAVPLFREALQQARAAGEDFLAIDAAHMLGIAAPPADRLSWNVEALAMTERTKDPRAKRWFASLYNNIGWIYDERSDYTRALEYFEKALPAWEARGDAAAVRAAKWAVAHELRSVGRYDEALAIQRALLAENEKAGEVDGFVFEELAELALARGDDAEARAWFAKAYAELAKDPAFKAAEPVRLERLRQLGGPQ